jgi:hypothetical protein
MYGILFALGILVTPQNTFAQISLGRMQPQVIDTQESIQRGAAVGAAGVPPQGAPTGAPPLPAQGVPTPRLREAPNNAPVSQMKMGDVSRNIQNGTLPPFRPGGDDVPVDHDWSKGDYEYSDRHRFHYGSVGAGNIGSGLCTAKNSNRTQVKAGYCNMLKDILETDGTCAKRMLDRIIEMDSQGKYQNGNLGGIRDIEKYCSNFSTLKTSDKRMAFQQILASLIVQESGWRADAREPVWFKNGRPMGGKGLFQIDERDASKPDCHRVDGHVFDPKINMQCGACIALSNIVRDGTMGHGTGESGARGMARYFGPLRDGQVRKRMAMQGAVNNWCLSAAAATGGGGTSTTR